MPKRKIVKPGMIVRFTTDSYDNIPSKTIYVYIKSKEKRTNVSPKYTYNEYRIGGFSLEKGQLVLRPAWMGNTIDDFILNEWFKKKSTVILKPASVEFFDTIFRRGL